MNVYLKNAKKLDVEQALLCQKRPDRKNGQRMKVTGLCDYVVS